MHNCLEKIVPKACGDQECFPTAMAEVAPTEGEDLQPQKTNPETLPKVDTFLSSNWTFPHWDSSFQDAPEPSWEKARETSISLDPCLWRDQIPVNRRRMASKKRQHSPPQRGRPSGVMTAERLQPNQLPSLPPFLQPPPLPVAPGETSRSRRRRNTKKLKRVTWCVPFAWRFCIDLVSSVAVTPSALLAFRATPTHAREYCLPQLCFH